MTHDSNPYRAMSDKAIIDALRQEADRDETKRLPRLLMKETAGRLEKARDALNPAFRTPSNAERLLDEVVAIAQGRTPVEKGAYGAEDDRLQAIINLLTQRKGA